MPDLQVQALPARGVPVEANVLLILADTQFAESLLRCAVVMMHLGIQSANELEKSRSGRRSSSLAQIGSRGRPDQDVLLVSIQESLSLQQAFLFGDLADEQMYGYGWEVTDCDRRARVARVA